MLFKRHRGRPPKKKFRFGHLILALGMGFLVMVWAARQGFIDRDLLNWQEVRSQVGSEGLVLGMRRADWQNRVSLLLQGLKEAVGERGGKNLKSPRQRAGRQISNLKYGERGRESGGRVVLKFGVLADSHEDSEVFPKILKQMQVEEVDFFVHLGDVVNSGEVSQLRSAKKLMDESGLVYYLLPGDHDYNWIPQHDLTNFKEIFGLNQTNQVYDYGNFALILLDNSNNDDALVDSSQRQQWLISQLEKFTGKNIFLFTSKPPVSPYFPDKADPNGRALLQVLKKGKIAQIFSGNTHTFARYQDQKNGVWITTAGAAGQYKNYLPMWALVEIFASGRIEVTAKPYL